MEQNGNPIQGCESFEKRSWKLRRPMAIFRNATCLFEFICRLKAREKSSQSTSLDWKAVRQYASNDNSTFPLASCVRRYTFRFDALRCEVEKAFMYGHTHMFRALVVCTTLRATILDEKYPSMRRTRVVDSNDIKSHTHQ